MAVLVVMRPSSVVMGNRGLMSRNALLDPGSGRYPRVVHGTVGRSPIVSATPVGAQGIVTTGGN